MRQTSSSLTRIRSFSTMFRGGVMLCGLSRSSFPIVNARAPEEGGLPGQRDFEAWSSNKIREAGPLAVPIIEELRREFAPAVRPLSKHKILQELHQWRSLSDIDVNFFPQNVCEVGDPLGEVKDQAGLSPRSRAKKSGSSGKGSQSEGSHDSDDDGNHNDDESLHPMLREFATYHDYEEALYFYNLFAYPWQKGAFERYVAKLEEKFFPDDLLDFDKPSKGRRSRNESRRDVRKERLAMGSMASASSRMIKSESNVPSPRLGSAEKLQPRISMGSSLDQDSERLPRARQQYPQVSTESLGGLYPSSNSSYSDSENSREESNLSNSSSRGEDGYIAVGVLRKGEKPAMSGVAHEKKLGDNRYVDEPKASYEHANKSPICSSTQDHVLGKEPILVTRSAQLPVHWDGPGGTVILIDKPQGWTSFAVCDHLRRLLGIQKVGHAGTLDPMATGLLIVCIGKATKLADSYQAMTKVYTGSFRLGEATPSYDADSEVCERLPWSHIQDSDIAKVKQSFIGDIMQVPPMYSAIKVGGERLYKRARRGEEIEVPPRKVSIYELEVHRSVEDKDGLIGWRTTTCKFKTMSAIMEKMTYIR